MYKLSHEPAFQNNTISMTHETESITVCLDHIVYVRTQRTQEHASYNTAPLKLVSTNIIQSMINVDVLTCHLAATPKQVKNDLVFCFCFFFFPSRAYSVMYHTM